MIKSLRPDEIGALAFEDLEPDVPEGSTSVALSLKKKLAEPLTLTYRLYDPADAQIHEGELELDAGAASVTLSGLPLPPDNALDEADRVYRIVIVDSLGKTSRIRLTVLDDDDPPTVSINDDTVTEGGSLSFTVSLSGPSGREISLTYGTVNGGTATSGADFTALAPTTVAIPAGDTSFTFSVATLDDSLHESSETVHVRLSSPVNVTISDDTGVGTINDNDASPTLSVSDASGLEGAGLVFTVSLSAASGRETTFEWGTVDGTASGGLDFTAVSGASATIASGGTSTTLTVSSLNDALTEGDETFSVVLTDPVNATLSDDTGIGTIQDGVAPGVPTAPGQFDDGAFYYSSSETPVLRWAASTGHTHYEVAIGTSSGGTNVLSWTNIGDVTNYQATGLTLAPGTMHYASVRAVGGGGTTLVNGDGWLALGQQKLAWMGPAWDGREGQARFGSSQALSEDGQILVVGAPYASLDEESNSVSSAGVAYVFVREGSSWKLRQKLAATGTNGRVENDNFGISVAISGETIVVGAAGQDFDTAGANLVNNAGAAYVFTRSSGVWSQQQKIVAVGTNARVAADRFGTSVAISGETLVVGASGQDFDADGADSASGAGAAYVFTRNGGVWSQQQKLVGVGVNARMADDGFGASVAISGETIVIGANGHDYDADGANPVSAGAVYVFTRGGGVWSQQQKLVATGANARSASDNFGKSVAISGETVVVGSHWHDYDVAGANSVRDTGAAYVFTRSGGAWTQQQKLVASGTNARGMDAEFGNSVAISGETIVIGSHREGYDAAGANPVSVAGAAYVFTRSGGVWSQQQKLVASGTNARMGTDLFGTSVVISGETLVAGAYGQDYDAAGADPRELAGAAYSFRYSGGVWTQEQKLTGSGLVHDRSSRFGHSLHLSEDGSTLVIGALNDGLDGVGNYVRNTGAAYVYVKQGGRWVLQQKLVASGTNARMESDQFGISVAISGDTIVVGASYQGYDASGANSLSQAGAAYVFTRSGGVWSQQQKLVATGTNARVAGDCFGYSVAISGETIAVGAYGQDFDASGANSLSQAGAVYVFTRGGGVWSQQQKLVATGANARAASDQFGVVAISGETLVVGALGQDYDADGADLVSNAGAAYVFTRSGGVWSQQQKIVTTGANARVADDGFGRSMAISGETLVVGATGQDFDADGADSALQAGAAYVFTRSGGVWSQQQKLVATGTNARTASDLFGFSVAISGETIVVGAHQQDYDAAGANLVNNAGAAYVFTRSGGVWSQQQKLLGTGTNARMVGDLFGSAVAISGEAIGVGASYQDYDVSGANPSGNVGAAHIFYAGSAPEPPQLSLAPASGVEGSLLTFRVTMSKTWPRDVTFKASTFGGSATSGADYTALTNATYTIPAGQTGVDIDVSTVNDGLSEGDENFRLIIHSADEASPVGPPAWGTIQDDD